MRKPKPRFFAALTLISSLLLAACSGSSKPSNSEGTDNLTLWFWTGSQAETATWQKIVDMVNAKYPKIKVNLQTSSWNDYWTKVPTQFSSQNAPCLVGLSADYVPQFANLMRPLSDTVASAGVTLADFDQGMLAALSTAGKLYALPYDMGPRFIYYNKDLFNAAGLAAPKNGWTVSDFEGAAKALTTNGKYGFGLNSSIDEMNTWGPTIGATLPATRESKLDLTNPGIVKTLSWYAGLVSKQKVAPELSSDPNASSNQSQFLAGNIAMYDSGAYEMVNIKAQAKFNVGVVTLPVGDGGFKGMVSGSGFGITQKCSNPDAALKALSVITGTDALTVVGTTGRGFPARPALWNTWYQNAVTGAQETIESSLKVASGTFSTPTWTQDSITWAQGVVGVANGTTDPTQFLTGVQNSSPSKK